MCHTLFFSWISPGLDCRLVGLAYGYRSRRNRELGILFFYDYFAKQVAIMHWGSLPCTWRPLFHHKLQKKTILPPFVYWGTKRKEEGPISESREDFFTVSLLCPLSDTVYTHTCHHFCFSGASAEFASDLSTPGALKSWSLWMGLPAPNGM